MKKKIDRFVLTESLGDSGHGAVYKAAEALGGELTRTVTVKVLPGAKEPPPQFTAEVQALAALTGHPHIVTLLGAGLTDDTPWIATEFLPTNLTSQAGDHPTLSEVVGKMLEHIARALEAMHGLEPPLLHNDLKPVNIRIDRFGRYKLAEFGAASPGAPETALGSAMVRYAAPELLTNEGKPGPTADLYALGHIAYELALGQRNYRRQFGQVFDGVSSVKEAPAARWMAWHSSLAAKPAPVSEVQRDFPQRLSEIIAKLMAKPLSERYASAKDMLSDLRGRSAVAAAAATSSKAPAAVTASSATAPAAPTSTAVEPPPAPDSEGPPPGPAPTTAAGRYYVRLRGRQTGPYDLPTLKKLARQGQVSRLHQVSSDGVSWQSAATVESLF